MTPRRDLRGQRAQRGPIPRRGANTPPEGPRGHEHLILGKDLRHGFVCVRWGPSVGMCTASTPAKAQYPAEATPNPSVLLCWPVSPLGHVFAPRRASSGFPQKGRPSPLFAERVLGAPRRGMEAQCVHSLVAGTNSHALPSHKPPQLRYACSWPRASYTWQRPSPWLCVYVCVYGVCVGGEVGFLMFENGYMALSTPPADLHHGNRSRSSPKVPVVSMLAAMIGIPVHVLPLPAHRKGGACGNMSDVRSRRAPSDRAPYR